MLERPLGFCSVGGGGAGRGLGCGEERGGGGARRPDAAPSQCSGLLLGGASAAVGVVSSALRG